MFCFRGWSWIEIRNKAYLDNPAINWAVSSWQRRYARVRDDFGDPVELRTACVPRRIAAASASYRALCNSPLLHRSPEVPCSDQSRSCRVPSRNNHGQRSITNMRSIVAGHSVTKRVGGRPRYHFCAGSDRWCNLILSADSCDYLFVRR